MRRVAALLDGAAADVELALEVVACGHVHRTRHEGLQDGRHAGARRGPEVVVVDGHFAPEEHGHALRCAAVLEDPAGIGHAALVLRAEEHGDAVVTLVGQQVAALLGLLAEEAMRHLEEDAGAVARVGLKALAATVLEVDQHAERVIDHAVRALPL